MKKVITILVLTAILGGGAVGVTPAPSYAQPMYGYYYPPPPPDPYVAPWVGPNTPWVYYNGDWFLNGILYYFFGPQYGWAPYYAYPPIFIVRPPEWYAPKWIVWYERHPHYWQNFLRVYSYWRGHKHGHRYDRSFYERHHSGQGAGWQEGFRGVKPGRPPEEQKPAPPRVAPREGRPPARVAPPEGRQPGLGGGARETAPKPKKAGPGAPKPEREGPGAALR